MAPASAFDLSPALQLMLMGLALALGPLLWVWLRTRGAPLAHRLRTLTLLTLFLCFDLVLFGAFTRLTDSGLGCPDWPGCYGKASPIGAAQEIATAQATMPTGPVTHAKAWIEMVHRYLASAVGVLILMLAAVTWWGTRQGGERVAVPVWWPVLTLVWVCLQGAFGALTVTMRLFPLVVTLHLLGGMVLLALLGAQATMYHLWHRQRPPMAVGAGRYAAMLVAGLLLLIQIALGGWVSTNYAVLACPDFPTCQASWWPAMDLRQGFELWRELGATADGVNIGFPALTAIHFVHRLFALLAAAVLLGLAAWLNRLPPCRIQAQSLAGLVLLQVTSGVGNVVLDWPLAAALLHTGGAAGLVLVLAWTLSSTRPGLAVARRPGVAAPERMA